MQLYHKKLLFACLNYMPYGGVQVVSRGHTITCVLNPLIFYD